MTSQTYTFTASVTENVPNGQTAASSQPFTVTTGSHLVGATSILNGYPAYSDRLALAQFINTQLNGNPATTSQKWFLLNWITSTTVGTGTHMIPVGLDELINAGCQIIMCASPVQSTNYGGVGDPSVADYGIAYGSPGGPTGLLGTLSLLQNKYGSAINNMWCVVSQEPNTNAKFPSGAAYGAYANYYSGAVQAVGMPLVCDLATNGSTKGNYQEYFEACSCQFSFLLADYYGNTWAKGYLLDQPFPNTPATKSFTQLADEYSFGPIPFGIGEWGNSQQGAASALPQTGPGSWADLCTYMSGLFANRHYACVNWFSGANSPEYNTIPNGAGYDLTAGINSVHAAIT